ncbi:MAG TPA: hypothetical protein VGE01_03675 [Fimbriimonas sp.]
MAYFSLAGKGFKRPLAYSFRVVSGEVRDRDIEFSPVPGVFPVAAASHVMRKGCRALANTPLDQCRTIYDLDHNELVAIANPPRFYFRDPANLASIYSSDQILSMIEPRHLGRRAAKFRRASTLASGDAIEYEIVYHFPRVGPTLLTYTSSSIVIRGADRRLLMNRIVFSALPEASTLRLTPFSQ